METNSFLRGYFYAAFAMYNYFHTENTASVDGTFGQLTVITKQNEKITFAINRGISPVGGNVPYASTHIDESLFDIVSHWVTPNVWNAIKETSENDEMRVPFKGLCNLIDEMGGIDVSATTKHYIKNFS